MQTIFYTNQNIFFYTDSILMNYINENFRLNSLENEKKYIEFKKKIDIDLEQNHFIHIKIYL